MPLLILVTLLSLKKPNSLPTESFSTSQPDITPTFYFISYSKTQLWRMTVLCCCLVTQSCLTLCDPIDCGLSGSYVHRISHTRTLEWVVIPFQWVFRIQGLNLCLLHWQVDSLLLNNQGNMTVSFLVHMGNSSVKWQVSVCVCVCVCTYTYCLCLLNREIKE